jgi:hypothetical protein
VPGLTSGISGERGESAACRVRPFVATAKTALSPVVVGRLRAEAQWESSRPWRKVGSLDWLSITMA